VDLFTENPGTKNAAEMTRLCALHFGDEARLLQLHPIGLVQLGTDEEVEVGDLVILAHERRRQSEFAMRLHDRENATKHLGRNRVHFCNN
jgi:hypothetical protein